MRRQHGSSLGETLILIALAALLVAALAAAFTRSMTHGVALIGAAFGAALLVLAFGILRDRRMERGRVERVRLALEEAAAGMSATLDASFSGMAQGGPAAFGVSTAARKLVHARGGAPRVVMTVLGFDEIAAAFARAEQPRGFRLEARARREGGGVAEEAPFVVVPGREDAERWVRVLEPHLGARAKLVEGGRVTRGE